MADSKIFRLTEGITTESIGREVETFLRTEKEMIAEGIASSDGYLVQAKEESGWKSFAGLSKALQVQIIPSGNSEVMVNIGNGKWIDKAGAAAVGMLLFAPFAITAAVGAYGQKKLPSEIFECIERYIMSGGKSIRRNVTFDKIGDNQIKCPSCGTLNYRDTKFCSGCGNKLINICPSCGAEVSLDKKFCPECGNSMTLIKTNKCPSCGAEVKDGLKFCPECGTSMEILNKNICPQCGAAVDKSEKFCSECGTAMSGAKICPKCGTEVAEGKKFCGQCGTKI